MLQSKPWRREDNTADSRWSSYIDQFSGMPIYYFEGLKYPESNREAVSTVQVLNAEIENISLQIIEIDTTIAKGSNLESSASDLYQRKTKALRAQKMKLAQIKILEAWQLNQSTDIEREIKDLSLKLVTIKSAMLHMLESTSDTSLYLRVADMLSEI